MTEYIITEEQITEFEACQFMTGGALNRFLRTIRSRPRASTQPERCGDKDCIKICRRYVENYKATIRKEEREKVLDELITFVDINEITSNDESGEETEQVVMSGEMRAKIESLRGEP